MKPLIIILALLSTAPVFAQKIKEKDVPPAVKAAFQKAYPDTKDVDWSKETKGYEAEFEAGETDYSVLIDEQGSIVETEVEISGSQLPQKITDYMKSNYPGKDIKEAARITDAKGTVTYEVEIKKKELFFDAAGNFLREDND